MFHLRGMSFSYIFADDTYDTQPLLRGYASDICTEVYARRILTMGFCMDMRSAKASCRRGILKRLLLGVKNIAKDCSKH